MLGSTNHSGHKEEMLREPVYPTSQAQQGRLAIEGSGAGVVPPRSRATPPVSRPSTSSSALAEIGEDIIISSGVRLGDDEKRESKEANPKAALNWQGSFVDIELEELFTKKQQGENLPAMRKALSYLLLWCPLVFAQAVTECSSQQRCSSVWVWLISVGLQLLLAGCQWYLHSMTVARQQYSNAVSRLLLCTN
jgi:hypothetical protein